MVKRTLDVDSNEIIDYTKEDLLESIKKSEGRTIVSEVISGKSRYDDLSNPELASSCGADFILLNKLRLNEPSIKNFQDSQELISDVKNTTGCAVGVNLEPVTEKSNKKISEGRKASLENAKKAQEIGADFILLTGNPQTGVENQRIVEKIKEINEELGEDLIIISGKMHSSGVEEKYADEGIIEEMIEAGADIILLPIPGTVPGLTLSEAQSMVEKVHEKEKLVIGAIGTSQETCGQETVKNLGLNSKRMGSDLHHIGDAGVGGIAPPENIMKFSQAIRGKRHTYRRMSK